MPDAEVVVSAIGPDLTTATFRAFATQTMRAIERRDGLRLGRITYEKVGHYFVASAMPMPPPPG